MSFRSPLHEVHPPLHEVAAVLMSFRLPLHEVAAVLMSFRLPLHEVAAVLMSFRSPLHEVPAVLMFFHRRYMRSPRSSCSSIAATSGARFRNLRDGCHVLGGELNVAGRPVLFEMGDRARARDGQHDARPCEQPRKADLR